MPLDPARGFATTPETRAAERLAELEREVRQLRRANPVVQAGAGAPTADASTLRTGTQYVDTTTNRLYVVVNGAWRYIALT